MCDVLVVHSTMLNRDNELITDYCREEYGRFRIFLT